MSCTANQASPFTAKGKLFYAVHFDDNTFVNNVTLENCVLINVSSKGCILSDVRFINVYLQDMEFVACDFNNFTWLSAGEFDQTWQEKTLEKRYLMGDKVPEQISDPQWIANMMGTQTIPEQISDPGPQWIADMTETQTISDIPPHGLPTRTTNNNASIYEQAPLTHTFHDRSSGVVQDRHCGLEGYDFSGLGNAVRPDYASQAEREKTEATIADWHDFADQMEAERLREREKEALQESLSGSAKEAARRAHVYPGSETDATDFVTGTSRASTDMSAYETQQRSNGPIPASAVATTDLRSPLQATSWIAQASPLPPHLHGTFMAGDLHGEAGLLQDDCGDDDDDEPVYRPAARFRR